MPNDVPTTPDEALNQFARRLNNAILWDRAMLNARGDYSYPKTVVDELARNSQKERDDFHEQAYTLATRWGLRPPKLYANKWGTLQQLRQWTYETLESLAPEPLADAPTHKAGPVQSHDAALPESHTIALAILFQEPEITPTELAKRVGVSRGTLYLTTPKWKPIRDTLTARGSGGIPRGTKSDDGSIEAEAECRESHPTRDNE